jgi:hypothetical protein
MGEAKRKAKRAAARSWAMGSIEIEANDQHCFMWMGTKDDAIKLQKDYLRAVETWTMVSAESYAKRVAGYLIVFGMPKVGDPDQRPSNAGMVWDKAEIAKLKAAILWMALREHIPDKPGQRLEDVVAGKALLVMLRGDARQILAETVRELNGQSFSNEDEAFTMTVGVLDDCRLDPTAAVTMDYRDLVAMAGRPPLETDSKLYDDPVRVPRIQLDAAEADAMLQMSTVFLDATDPAAMANPEAAICTYCGYTDDELRRGKPAVIVK